MAEWKTPKYLWIDLDGTLLGSTPALRWNFVFGSIRFFGKRGIGPVKALRAVHALRKGTEIHEPGIKNADRAIRRLARALGCEESEARVLAVELVSTVFPSLERCFFPIDGAAEFIAWARERFALVLATNPVWPRGIVELRLKWSGIDPHVFGFIANNAEMHHCKPSVEYYRELLTKLGLQAEEALMVGDSAKKDLPASKLGIPVFLLSSESSARQFGENRWRGNFQALQTLLTKGNVGA